MGSRLRKKSSEIEEFQMLKTLSVIEIVVGSILVFVGLSFIFNKNSDPWGISFTIGIIATAVGLLLVILGIKGIKIKKNKGE